LEILGAPKEHIVKELQDHVDKLKKEGLDIQTEKYAEPKEQDDLFSQFVELQIAFKDSKELLNFCFDSMPSSVEIMSPEKIQMDSTFFEQLLNDFQAKLHHADMMLKNITAQKQVLDYNAINIMHNFIKFVCRCCDPAGHHRVGDRPSPRARHILGFRTHPRGAEKRAGR